MGEFLLNYIKVLGAFVVIIFALLGYSALLPDRGSGTGALGVMFYAMLIAIFIFFVVLGVYTWLVF